MKWNDPVAQLCPGSSPQSIIVAYDTDILSLGQALCAFVRACVCIFDTKINMVIEFEFNAVRWPALLPLAIGPALVLVRVDGLMMTSASFGGLETGF